MFDLVVFDVDGTLLDTSEGILASVKYTIDYFNFEPLDDATIKTFIGPPIQNSFAKAYHMEGQTERLQEIATVFRNQYKDNDLLKAVPYDGIYELMDYLKENNIPIAIATYKRQDYAEKIVKHFGFDKYTTVIYGGDHENKLKKVDIIRKCMDELGIKDYSNSLMIGDSDNDAIGAKNIGMQFYGVTYGYGFKTKDDVNEFDNVGCSNDVLGVIDYFKNRGE